MQQGNQDTAILTCTKRAFPVLLAVLLAILLSGCTQGIGKKALPDSGNQEPVPGFTLADVPAYDGQPSVSINGGAPFFSEADLARGPFEQYSDLDSRGRCGQAFALIGPETMPTAPRGSVSVKPSGWQISKYGWIDGEYLFNRCHLIAYSLAGENDNPLNLITGTRNMNAQGMLPYEERVAAYVDRTGNHVLYRVTPYFEGDNLVASGVLMEAQSIEDEGAGINFCVWCYNVEPGVTIDYATGDNWASESGSVQSASASSEQSSELSAAQPSDGDINTYILNTRSKRFHWPDCHSVAEMKDKNKQEFTGTRDEAIAMGYKPCGECNP